jgi:hypothetical protein
MKKFSMSFVLVLVLVGCVPTSQNNHPTISKVITGDLAIFSSGNKRFAMYPSVNASYLPGGEGSERVIATTKNSICQIMGEKGYVLVPINENPDFIVGFGLGLESKITDDEIFDKAGMVVGLSTEGINPKKCQKGTALIAVFSPGPKEPRWRVLAQGISSMKKTDEARKESIHHLMALMLSSVPPVKKEAE